MVLADTLFVSLQPRPAQAIGRHAETKNRDRSAAPDRQY